MTNIYSDKKAAMLMAIDTVEQQATRLWPIDSIVVRDRKRELGDVISLSQSINELGLLNPITITPAGVLIAGYHRLEACKSLGWPSIPANVVNLDALNAELAEIDENLIRNELHWFDRDKQLARRKEIYETLHPETRHGNTTERAKVKVDNLPLPPSFVDDTASKAGVSDFTIKTSVQRAHAFTDEEGEILKQAEVTQTEATKIARLPEPERAAAIESLKERRDAHVLRVMGSSDSPEWYTPRAVLDCVLDCFGEIDLDPCSNSHEHPAVPARTLYTRAENGLIQSWRGKVYLNPPYGSEVPTWVQKLVQDYEDGNIEEAIALLPGRIDTNWFQPLYAYLMCNVHGRLQFANSPYNSPFPAVIVYLGRRPEKFIEAFKDLGPIMRRIG